MFCKSFVLLYYCIRILKSMLNDNLNFRHQSKFTNILRNHRAWSEHIQLRKTLHKFYQQKLLNTYFRCFDPCNEVYNHQLFSISINFTRKFCRRWSRILSGRVAGWPQKIFELRSGEKNFRGSSRGLWGHAPPENF